MRRFGQFFAPTIPSLLVAACVSAPLEPVSWPDIAFTSTPPIEFNVAEIKIVNAYREPLEPPYVGEQFPVSPSRAARNWAEDRLRAVGNRGTLTVTIRESSAVEEQLKPSGGLTGMLTKEQSERYTVVIDMEVRVLDPVGPRAASASARTKKSITVREDATLEEREHIWYELTRDAITTFDAAIEAQIRKTLDSFVRR